MSLYLQTITPEKEILKNEIEFVVKGFSEENDERFDVEPDTGYVAFKHYNDLREKHFNLEGPRLIYNDPPTASRQCTTELTMLKGKIEARIFEKKVSAGRSVEIFIAEMDVILKNLHDTPICKLNRKYKQQRERIPYDNLLETIQLNQYQISKCPITAEKRKIMITRKQYEQLSIKSNEMELAHLYYLAKAHKPVTPLCPIISGLKHPTIKVSKFLDELLRPLFNKMASNTTVTSGTENGKYFHQVHVGAMGSTLTLTIANCYMYFYERDIVKQVNNSNGLYLRCIDDILIIINWPIQHLSKQINRWNELDLIIKLKAQVGHSTNFLDLYIENKNGELFTKLYHKPSYEAYYLPFNGVHPIHAYENEYSICYVNSCD
ncbi:unnamed protein product [Rotaria sp. Silwood1]|nr:unnamed protein product [Rotaria sp. Silwood1]